MKKSEHTISVNNRKEQRIWTSYLCFAKFDLVAWIFGGQTASFSRVVYALVGLAGLWCITLLFRRRETGRT